MPRRPDNKLLLFGILSLVLGAQGVLGGALVVLLSPLEPVAGLAAGFTADAVTVVARGLFESARIPEPRNTEQMMQAAAHAAPSHAFAGMLCVLVSAALVLAGVLLCARSPHARGIARLWAVGALVALAIAAGYDVAREPLPDGTGLVQTAIAGAAGLLDHGPLLLLGAVYPVLMLLVLRKPPASQRPEPPVA
jgi:hypothetical protein